MGDSLQVHNITAKLGLQYQQPLAAQSYLTVGATYQFATRILGTHNRYEVQGINRNPTVSTALVTTGAAMGDELGVGISYRKADIFMVEADYTRTDWRGSRMDLVAGFSNVGDVAFAPSVGQSVRVGVEITPNRNDIRYFFKRCTYRAGAYFDQSYYTVGGAHVDAVGITLGMTLPVFRWYNGLSLGIDLGQRGLASQQVKERYFGFNIGLNMFDIWFKKPHYE